MRRIASTIFLLMLAATLASCTDISLPSGTSTGGEKAVTTAPGTSQPTETTAAPDTTDSTQTTAPDTTLVETEGGTTPEGTEPDTGSGIDPSTLLIVLGLVVAFLLLGWLMGRSRKPAAPTPSTPPLPTWKDHLRQGYEESRWLADSMTEDLAIWRGNVMSGSAATGAGTSLADRWAHLDTRVEGARDHLYRAEASSPDQTSSALIRACIDALNAARAAVDARADARLASISSEGDASAAERERIASTNLAEARAALDAALVSVGGMI